MKRFQWGLVAALFLLGGVMFGQTVNSQQITGAVSDSTGALLPNATVVVSNAATGLTRTVQTNGEGNYTALDLPVGTYKVSVSIPGFKATEISDIHLEVGGKPSIPVTLQVGQQTDVVTVEADPLLIKTTSAEVGAVVTAEQATKLQLNGRNYVQLIALAPGVSQTVASGFALFGQYGVSGNAQSIDGNRPDNSNYFIDGVDNKDNGGGGNNYVNISPDALEEFRTAGSSYDASYGGSAGATISVAMKSGTRSFHGSAYEFLRNDAIQAFQFQPLGTKTPIKPPLRYNDFGWTFGGPLYIPGHFNASREKFFFFAGEEFKRLRQSTITQTTVPTAAQRTGDFGNGPLPQCGGSVTANCSTANGRALVNLFPKANDSTGTSFTYPSLGPLNSLEYFVRGDYNLNAKNQISGHFVHDEYDTLGTPTGSITFQRKVPGLTSSVQWTHTFNEKTVNTLTGSFSGNVVKEDTGIGPNSLFGLTSITRAGNGLNYTTLFNASAAIPTVTVSGYTSLSSTALNFNNYQRIYAGKDDFSRVIGNHSLKAGLYAWRSRKNQTAIPAINGTFGFTASNGNNALINALEGKFATYQEGSSIQEVDARFTQIEGYVQDDWTVSRRLTLNLGLRYQYMQPVYSALANGSAFDPAYYDPNHAATVNSAGIITSNPYPYNGLVLGGSGFPPQAQGRVALASNTAVQGLFHNLPAGLVNTYWDTPAPRVGFAYDVTGRQTTVVHGGYGLSYERIEGNYYYNSVNQLPFTSIANVTNGNVDTLASANPAAANATTITNSRSRNLEPPRVKNWSVGVQQRLSADTIFELNYVGSSSANLSYYQNINQEAAGTQQAHPGVAANALRPYLGYQDIFQSVNGAIFNYHSLQASALKQMRRGGTVRLSYTWSKELTDAPYYNYNPQDSFNIRGDYGGSNFNQPQIFVASYVYPLPFWQHGHEWYKQAFGGFEVSGITRISSGLPINVVQPANTSVSGNGVTSVSQRPNLVGNPFAGNGYKQYLNAAAFAIPAAGTYGNLEAFGIKGPLYDNWDLALQKTFQIRESLGVEFRAESFNFPNHLSAFSVSNTLGTGNFGQVTGTTDPRTFEFALKAHF